jgi:hypothetical protein
MFSYGVFTHLKKLVERRLRELACIRDAQSISLDTFLLLHM